MLQWGWVGLSTFDSMEGDHFQRTQFLSLDHDVSPSVDHKQLSLTGAVARLGKCLARVQETLSSIRALHQLGAAKKVCHRNLQEEGKKFKVLETQFRASLGCVKLYLKKEKLNFIYLEKMDFSNMHQALLCLLFRFQGSSKCCVMRDCGV